MLLRLICGYEKLITRFTVTKLNELYVIYFKSNFHQTPGHHKNSVLQKKKQLFRSVNRAFNRNVVKFDHANVSRMSTLLELRNGALTREVNS